MERALYVLLDVTMSDTLTTELDCNVDERDEEELVAKAGLVVAELCIVLLVDELLAALLIMSAASNQVSKST